ncbi:MAG TPA: hypothetical protein VMZ69_00065 [Saprospiraceae bacterium]|nr:hypothetical protein [Saprospiraceae bacterium]
MNDFKEVNLEDITSSNAPAGLERKSDGWGPAEGWELLPSKDGKQVMLLQTGTNTGSAGYECKCEEGSGACGTRKDIIMCIADVCTKCKTVLKIYNNHISVDRTKW